MKKLLFVAACSALLFVSCGKKECKKSDKNSCNKEQVADIDHSSKNALDWAGEYEGTLPCADCSGIQTKIVINEDGTFKKTEKYLEKKDGVFESKGTFSWDKTGSIITLKDEKENTELYKVGEGRLILLNADGIEVTGELANDYVLSKK